MNQCPIIYGSQPEFFVDLTVFDAKLNLYIISSYGRVFFKDTLIPVIEYVRDGYPYFNMITNSGGRSTVYIHRLVCAQFNGFPLDENKNIVNHIIPIPNLNNYDNLEWCTQKENIAHAIALGNFKVRGEDNITSRLTNEQVHLICKYLSDGIYEYADILKFVGLEADKRNLDLITKIRTKKLWVHISDLYDIPEKEYRSEAVDYNNYIHSVCELLSKGYTIADIIKEMNMASNHQEYDKSYKFIKRVKERKTYTDISKNYIW